VRLGPEVQALPRQLLTAASVDGEIIVRPLGPDDSIGELTDLLHRAYAQLAKMGLRFLATHQDDAMTAKRISHGECFVALRNGELCGTILYKPRAGEAGGPPWYGREGVAGIAQFAVEPKLQANGRLIDMVEQQARESGAAEISLDTAEPATHLVGWYSRLGYRFIEHWQWSYTNYRSVVLSKSLG
jgi:predicted N-acetyltransferase YhbS